MLATACAMLLAPKAPKTDPSHRHTHADEDADAAPDVNADVVEDMDACV